MHPRVRTTTILFVLLVIGSLILVTFMIWPAVWGRIAALYALVTDQKRIEALLKAWGPMGAPLVFVGVQILQVIFAPIPGEASGFVGGYLFGTLPGFVYSTIGLTVGSVINFALGRILGRRYVAKWIPSGHLNKFDRLAKRQGALLFFVLFVLPGFPKDYLCILLGLTSLSVKAFVPMVGIGRMPGTLILSLQGAQVFQKDFVTLAFVLALSLIFVIPAYVWRERIYDWIERFNTHP